MRRYLEKNWISSLGDGGLPDRLREIAEYAYGKARADSEFEAALKSLRTDQGPEGPSIEIHLFGQWLPIPVPVVWRDDADLKSAEDIRDAEPPVRVVAGFDINLEDIAESLRSDWDSQDINQSIGGFERRIGTCAPEFNTQAYQKYRIGSKDDTALNCPKTTSFDLIRIALGQSSVDRRVKAPPDLAVRSDTVPIA
ncbi:MAG: hypothetical protein IPK97_02290 [Ahniella sp.]|nr:hypothetical protein [Ahniella sp.]